MLTSVPCGVNRKSVKLMTKLCRLLFTTGEDKMKIKEVRAIEIELNPQPKTSPRPSTRWRAASRTQRAGAW